MAVRLTLRALSKRYGPGPNAVDGVDLEVKEAERMVLLGPSGCGKTTTLRLVAGLLAPDSGDILFDDESVLDVAAERRGAVMVFQQHALFPFKTVGENVGFGLRLRRVSGQERRDRIAETLADVRLAGFEDRWPDELSGGERQRVALARALVVQPRVLLLDEPLSSLDPSLRDEVRDVICSVQRDAGITTVMVTHDQTEAMAVADRIALMMDGRIRQIGSPHDLYERPVDLDVARFFGAENVLPGTKRGNVVQTVIGELRTDDGGAPDGPVLATIRPDEIQPASAGEGALSGRVTSSRYLGVAVDCEVSFGGTAVRYLAGPADQPAPGDEIRLRFPPRHVRVVPAHPSGAHSETDPHRS